MGSCSFFCVFSTKKPPKFTSCHSLPLWKTPRPNIAVWWLSTPPKFDFNRPKPPNCLILCSKFQKMAEMSTDFSTACGKLLGITVEKSTGKGVVFHRGIAPLQSSIFCQKRAEEKGGCLPTFFEKGVAFLEQVCYNDVVKISYLPVAQLDSASDSDSEGRRFESFRVGQKGGSRVAASPFCSFLSSLFVFLFSLRSPRARLHQRKDKRE